MDKQEMKVSEYLELIYSGQKKIETLLLSQKTVFNFEQMVEYTGLSRSFLYKLSSTGRVPCSKPNGKLIFFEKKSVDDWLLRNQKATNEELETEANTYITLNEGGK